MTKLKFAFYIVGPMLVLASNNFIAEMTGLSLIFIAVLIPGKTNIEIPQRRFRKVR